MSDIKGAESSPFLMHLVDLFEFNDRDPIDVIKLIYSIIGDGLMMIELIFELGLYFIRRIIDFRKAIAH